MHRWLEQLGKVLTQRRCLAVFQAEQDSWLVMTGIGKGEGLIVKAREVERQFEMEKTGEMWGEDIQGL